MLSFPGWRSGTYSTSCLLPTKSLVHTRSSLNETPAAYQLSSTHLCRSAHTQHSKIHGGEGASARQALPRPTGDRTKYNQYLTPRASCPRVAGSTARALRRAHDALFFAEPAVAKQARAAPQCPRLQGHRPRRVQAGRLRLAPRVSPPECRATSIPPVAEPATTIKRRQRETEASNREVCNALAERPSSPTALVSDQELTAQPLECRRQSPAISREQSAASKLAPLAVRCHGFA